MDNFEICWTLGIYDGQECILCPYHYECSGFEDKDDEEDDE